MLSADKEILFFGPRPPQQRSSIQHILWPALAYRVTAPRIRNQRLNPLQKAVALLVRTGLLQANEIGPKLDIDDKLAELILAELTQQDLLTPTGLSRQGLEILDNESILSYEWVSGFVFQDPWSGKLWPRFVADFSYCDHSVNDGKLLLHLGTEGKPRDVRPTWIEFPEEATDPVYPSKEDVVRAIRRSYSQRNRLGHGDASDETDGIEMSGGQIGEISYVTEIDPLVRRIYLTTLLYVPGERMATQPRFHHPPEWAACDPFGGPEIPELFLRISEVARTDQRLQNTIDRLLEDAGYKPGYKGLQEWEARAEEDARASITRIFSSSIQGYDGIFHELVGFEKKFLTALDVPERIAGLPRDLLKVIEAAFIWCLGAYPPGDIWKRVFHQSLHRKTGKLEWFAVRSRQDYASAYQYAAKELGLEPTQRILNTKPSHIRLAIEEGYHSKLTALICAQVMYAAEVNEHPLRKTASQMPDLLQRLDAVMKEGGKAGHADEKPSTIQRCQELRCDCFRIVASLLNLSITESEIGS